jgi:radical SAM protein with 4Fe4S-binding SPASM domain
MRGPLKPEDFGKITDQFTANNFIPRVVVLYHGGEPLINKHLGEYIKTLKAMGVKKVVTNTNGGLLTPERAQELIESGLDELRISFDGESAEENNSLRKNGDFKKNAANVKFLIKLRHDLGRKKPSIIIDNIRICDEKVLRSIASQEKGMVLAEPPSYLTDHFRRESQGITFRSFPAMVWPGYKHFGDFGVLQLPQKKTDYCSLAFETFTILSNGDVVPCCYDLRGEVVFGNAFKSSIYAIWASPHYIAFRDNFRNQKYANLCERCVVIAARYLLKGRFPAKKSSQTLCP